MTAPRVVIAGGGTGGHLYPGIAVARELLRRRPDATITFAGTARGIESRVIPREGFELDVLRSTGLKGMSAAALVRGLALLPLSGVDAWQILSRRRPQLVIGVGGYSSGPVVALAAARRIPTLLLEQNAVPGFTNRRLAAVVSAAAVTFESSVGYFGRRGFVAGNPVRPEFFVETVGNAAPGPPRVLIFGGSQGSHAINVAMVEAAPLLAEDGSAGGSRETPARGPSPAERVSGGGGDVRRGAALAITHQTGERDLELVRDGYKRAGLDARVEPFLFAMDREMKDADLVVSRAGATTLSELTAAGKPAILVPLPTAADDHQRKNAEVLQAAGAAVVIEQKDLTGERIFAEITALVGDPQRMQTMSAAARRLARPDAARVIVDRALALIEG